MDTALLGEVDHLLLDNGWVLRRVAEALRVRRVLAGEELAELLG